MSLPIIYWIKWSNNTHPEKWVCSSYEELWHDLREFMLRNNTSYLEWMIRG